MLIQGLFQILQKEIIGKIKQMDTIVGEHQYQEAKIRKLHMGVELIMVICLMIF